MKGKTSSWLINHIREKGGVMNVTRRITIGG